MRYVCVLFHFSFQLIFVVDSSFFLGSERFNESLELIKEQNLYKEALRLFSGSEYKTIAVNYGEYLMDGKKYEEAGVGSAYVLLIVLMKQRNGNLYKIL